MRNTPPPIARSAALLLATGLALGAAAADDAPPTGFEYEWGADVMGAGFFNSGSWFGESVPFLGADTDQWLEFGAEAKFKFSAPSRSGASTIFGEVSALVTATSGDDASGLTIGEDPSEAGIEQLHLGWRIDDPFEGLAGDTFSISVGNQDYKIGSGMLILDGGGDGGEKGGWFLGMRKAFQESILAQVKSDTWTVEGFRLKNRPRQGGTQGEALGANLEYALSAATRIGGTWMSVDPNTPGSDTADVLSGRFDHKPDAGLGFSGEYALESSDTLDSAGYFAQVSWTTSDMAWSPVFSYRFAHFDGDDPSTVKDERFREIAYGYTDYGSWYQGEISGNYPLGNGNLESHLLRVKLAPSDSLTLNALYYQFSFVEPASLGLTSDDWGDEFNLTADWAVNDNLYLIGVFAVLVPGDAAVQMTGGDDDWVYTMVYASYTW